MVGLYIVVSEMSIVGPPPRFLGGVFFCSEHKRALGSGSRLKRDLRSYFNREQKKNSPRVDA